MTDIFKQATKLPLRFDSSKGLLTVEDLWKLPLTSNTRPSLDGIAIAVNTELQAHEQQSFVTPSNIGSKLLSLKLEVLKDIIATRQEDNAAIIAAGAKAANKSRIREIIATKKDGALHDMTIEELEALEAA